MLVAIDQLFNTMAGGNPDVTISSHLYSMSRWNSKWMWLHQFIDWVFLPIEHKHCEESYLADSDVDESDNYIRTSIIALLGGLLLIIPVRLIALIYGDYYVLWKKKR